MKFSNFMQNITVAVCGQSRNRKKNSNMADVFFWKNGNSDISAVN